ncbi:EAL domain-containing protein [Sideroxyarcus sp. TK5]|jgi:diguanylate cyclase (GGDEF)-like protein/PAS domain S-box-containing protein
MNQHSEPRPQPVDIFRIVALYAAFAGLWILFSDELLRRYLDQPILLELAQTIKGTLFVAVTSVLLYLLLRKLTGANFAGGKPLRTHALVAWPRWQLYAFAATITVVSLMVRNSIAPAFDERPLLLVQMLPILLSAALGGLGPGLFATALSALGLTYFAIPPLNSFAIGGMIDLVHMFFLVLNGALVSALSHMLHESRARAEQEHARTATALAERSRAVQLLDGIAEGATDAIFAKDRDGRYLLFNRAAARYVGKSADEVLGRDDTVNFPPEQAAMVMADDRKVMESGRVVTNEHKLTTTQGETVFSTTQGPLYDAHGNVFGVFGIARDITALKAIERQLRQQRDFAETLIDTAQTIILVLDPEGRIMRFNDYMEKLSGWTLAEVSGRDWFSTFLPPAKQDATRQLFRSAIHDINTQGNIDTIVARDGRELSIEWYDKTLKDHNGNTIGLLAVGMNVTEQRRAEQQIHQLAFYDSLTGLPNRALLLDRLGMMLPIALRQKRHDALLVVNIDRFKGINDTSGQAVGDALLKAVAERLTGLLREGDVLARVSGDEFAILLPDLSKQLHAAAHQAMHVAEKVHYGLREAFEIGDERFSLTVSLGIALFPMHTAEDAPLDILRRANTALHQAKAAGGGRSTMFEQSMDDSTKQRFQLERELRQAIAAGELRLYLQPQVDASGRTVGAEALVRWQHPQRGLVPPALFIPIAEESDLIIDIGQWVMSQACKLLADETLLGRPYRIAVNISPRQFRQPDFVPWLQNMLAECGAEPTHLTLEVTEGVVIDNIGNVIAKMNELAIMGIHFSLDDFGTGYSSLAYLKRLPINELKIDKTFVQDAPSDPNDAALIESILAVARHMHLKVVAEGVETQEQADFLNQRGEVIHQGYLFGRPEPAETVLAGLAD